ncbi:MAG: hypothetical protein IJJ01_01135, partial [Firmicutes bacterium]|nr:hypothetical protein [Bacillota bacterium]
RPGREAPHCEGLSPGVGAARGHVSVDGTRRDGSFVDKKYITVGDDNVLVYKSADISDADLLIMIYNFVESFYE